MVPVNPTDRWLLGMRWKDQVFVDKTLLFGLRSAPFIFSAVADALAWIMKQRGVSFTGTPVESDRGPQHDNNIPGNRNRLDCQ